MTLGWDQGIGAARARREQALFWRLFLVNGVLLVAAVAALALTPATVSFPVTVAQATTLAVGVALLLGANALVLRTSLRPLDDLVALMRRVDLLVPGERARPLGATELQVLAATFNAMLDRLESERRRTSGQALDRSEDERRRLAHELHDEVGQRLTAVLLELRGAVEDAPASLVPRLSEIQALVRTNLDEVRRIARNLRPMMLDDLGLGYALDGLLDVVEERAGLQVVRTIDEVVPRLPEETELAVYRVAQEALTNVVRHAQARRVELILTVHEQTLRLDVRDDGRGMLCVPESERGGVRGMRERAVFVGGVLDVAGRPGEGTSVTLTVPLEP